MILTLTCRVFSGLQFYHIIFSSRDISSLKNLGSSCFQFCPPLLISRRRPVKHGGFERSSTKEETVMHDDQCPEDTTNDQNFGPTS